ncbi:MAG: hypothetical protein RIM84_18485 [Alphaproteobacteria bacterium]
MTAMTLPRFVRPGRCWLVPLLLAVLPVSAFASGAASAGELWFRLDVESLNLVQAVTQRYLAPWLWDPAIVTLLQWPAWLVASIPAALAAVVCALWRRN